MNGDAEPKLCPDDADAQAQVPCRTDDQRIAGKELPEFLAVHDRIVVSYGDHPVGEREVFGMFQNLVDSPSRLDRPGDGKMAVAFQQQLPSMLV